MAYREERETNFIVSPPNLYLAVQIWSHNDPSSGNAKGNATTADWGGTVARWHDVVSRLGPPG